MKIYHMEQGSAEWLQFRHGKITGSRLGDVMGSNLDRVKLIAELIAERGTELTKSTHTTPEMERGLIEEDFAIKAFEKKTGKKVTRVGACVSDAYDWLMVSPDGLIETPDGYTEAVEVKSPNSATLVFYKLCNLIPAEELGLTASKRTIEGIPPEYIGQILQYFIVNEKLRKLHFITYDVRFLTEDQRLYVVEVTREQLRDKINEAFVALTEFRATWKRWESIIVPDNF